jgi:hypothetical protein
MNLRDPKAMTQLLADIEAASRHTGLPVRLVVFDTLFRCFGGGDLNANVDMGEATGAVGRITEGTGAAVLLVHHENRTGTQFGSIMLYGAVDASLCVKRIPDTLQATITADKMKDAEEPNLDLTAEVIRLIDPMTGEPMVDPGTGRRITSLVMASAVADEGGRTGTDGDGHEPSAVRPAGERQASLPRLADRQGRIGHADGRMAEGPCRSRRRRGRQLSTARLRPAPAAGSEGRFARRKRPDLPRPGLSG